MFAVFGVLFKFCLKIGAIMPLDIPVSIKKESVMKTYILYNPLSGTGTAKADAEALLLGYENAESIDITTVKVSDLVDTLTEDDTIIICGGDGTINRFANDVYDIDVKCGVLYYPSGTGNDFLRDIEKSKGDKPIDIKKYIKDLPTVTVKGKSYRFINGVGYGIDGYCCEVGDKMKASSDKPVNYTSIAIKGLLFHFKPVNARVTIDGKTSEYKKVWIAPTMFGRHYGGGMIPTPDQQRTAEQRQTSLMVFHGSGKLKTLMIFPSIFKGEHVKKTKYVTVMKGSEITVEFDRPTPLQIDGETVLGVTKYTVHADAKVLSKV
jgi:diacylglycerol kinase family enzyme